MNFQYRIRPLSTWSWPTTRSPIHAPFLSKGQRTSWSKTVDLLERELRMLTVRQCILEIDVRESDIRLDGWIRANARPLSHRVIVTFEHRKHGWLRYPCDRFTHWQDNVRAVALALEALRKVDRYGVSPSGEQYAGWKALPSSTSETMSSAKAATVIADVRGMEDSLEILGDWEYAQRCIRAALHETHPDKGGTNEQFHAVQTARKILTVHHGVAT